VRGFALLAPLALLAAGPALADGNLPPAPFAYRQLDDPAQEAKAKALMETLRCLVCQSQSIADSDAPIAGDMRSEVRIRIARGEEPEAIRSWLIQRYGDYVTYQPRLDRLTWPLFALPVLVLVAALAGFARRIRRKDTA
jgi:cytochrome c-type biogenesis protein CcmH